MEHKISKYSVLCFATTIEKAIHIHFLNCLSVWIALLFLIFNLHWMEETTHSFSQADTSTYKSKKRILRFWNGEGKANEMKQYQNQDFWVELNDKHIDGIDFTCTQPKSERNVLVPIRRNSLYIAISAKGLRRIENNKHTTAAKSNFMCNGK